MAILQIYPNETQKNQDIQNQQTFIALQNIFKWSSDILTQTNIDYIQSSDSAGNATTNSIAYTPIPNFSFNFVPKNALGLTSFTLTVQGIGIIGIFVNDLLLREIPFNNTTFSQVNFNRAEKYAIGNNKISLAWKVSSGTITMARTRLNPYLNSFQIISVNS